MRPETITESEIEAYLDGELDLRRRLAVESHLATNPAAAAHLMADMRSRTALRLLADGASDPPSILRDAADRLSARLAGRLRRRMRLVVSQRIVQGLAAAALFAVILIPARIAFANPPDYVADAVEAYHTGLLRAAMVSQVETPRFDAREVQRNTHIRVPRLPARWVVTDAQIFPSDEGPALQLMIRTPSAKKLSIFAIRARTKAPEEPTAIRHEGATVAYWSEGDMSYALTGGDTPETLDVVADDIADDDMVVDRI